MEGNFSTELLMLLPSTFLGPLFKTWKVTKCYIQIIFCPSMFLYLLEACKVLLTTFGGGGGAGAEFRLDNVVADGSQQSNREEEDNNGITMLSQLGQQQQR